MPIWWAIGALPVVLIGVVYSMSQGGGGTKQQTTMKDNFEAPTASRDRLKPKLYGTRWITGGNLVDYGKYSAKPVWSD